VNLNVKFNILKQFNCALVGRIKNLIKLVLFKNFPPDRVISDDRLSVRNTRTNEECPQSSHCIAKSNWYQCHNQDMRGRVSCCI
jgi:hypothetical protein